jgi:hypothetical protein
MLAALGSSQSKMAAGLPGSDLAELFQTGCQLVAGDIAWKLHAAITSSRTK